MSEPELLPCPVCGSHVEFTRASSIAIIRAFVERVDERYMAAGESATVGQIVLYGDCIREELAAMEKEAE